MPSFDVVSKVDMHEVKNALDGVCREIEQRYDFKGSKSEVSFSEKEITILADDDFKMKQIHELFKVHFTRRKVDPKYLDFKDPEAASHNMIRQKVLVKEGIEKELAKKLVKDLKDSKLKVQAAIQGDELRVTGKKRDDLQDAIAFFKAMDVEQPLQFVNFRD